jgi:hypothetical protein
MGHMVVACGCAYVGLVCCSSRCCLQDLKCFVFSLISAHFKIQPIQK